MSITMHEMNLNDDPFKMISSGEKTVEMRLFDEKRQKIKEGDVIVFTNIISGETVSVRVDKALHYKDFESLYDHHSKTSIGYREDEIASPSDMLTYYSVEQIEKYGVLAIVISRLEK